MIENKNKTSNAPKEDTSCSSMILVAQRAQALQSTEVSGTMCIH